MGSSDDHIRNAFVEESLEHLSSIEEDLIHIENAAHGTGKERVNKVFRAVHTIKGGAGFLGLANITALSHAMETVLGRIREETMDPNAEVIHFLLQASDALTNIIQYIDHSDKIDVSEPVAALDNLCRAVPPSTVPPSTVPPSTVPPAGIPPAGVQSPGVQPTPGTRPLTVKEKSGAAPAVGDKSISDTNDSPPAPKDGIPENKTADMPDDFGVSAPDGTRLLSMEKPVFTRLMKEDHTVYFVELPLEKQKKTKDDLLAMIQSQAGDYGALVQHRVVHKHTPLAGYDESGPFFLMLYASVLATEEICILFELENRFVHALDMDGRIEPADLPAFGPDQTGPDQTDPDLIDPDQTDPDHINPESTDPGHSDPEPVAGEPFSSSHPGRPSSAFEPADKTFAPSPKPLAGASHSNLPQDGKTPPVLQPQDRIVPTRVRVNLTLLDNLMTLAEEMVLSRNQLLQAISTQDPRAIQRVGQRVNLITSELQETVMLTRMQPMGTIFDRFPRLVRDLGASLGKKINLVIKGRRVELDKTLLEAVADPLIHLVRNSIDHGIEPPDVRKQAGKDPMGRIILKASHGAGKVLIEVIDDGRGLDPQTLAEQAVSRGMITREQAAGMGEEEKSRLIFMPGVSTSEKVNDLSGRGVGMDVVKSNIEAIGGNVTVESQPGLGTRFLIAVPLTLAIIPCQIVLAENQRFAIPQANLEEMIRIPPNRVPEKIEFIGGAPVIRLRDDLLPLLRLTQILELQRTFVCPDTGTRRPDHRDNIADRRTMETGPDPSEGPERRTVTKKDRRYHADSALNIAVVSTGSLTYGLIVDELQDAEEIVVKPLGRHLKPCRVYAGATIMGDGRVALILDISSLADTSALSPVNPVDLPDDAHKKRAGSLADDRFAASFLTFRGASRERFAIFLDQVIRIEKIPAAHMETMGKMTVVQTRNTPLPLCALDEVADIGPVPLEEIMTVVICDAGGRKIGLRVTGPVDAVKTLEPMNVTTLRQPGISGSFLLDGHTFLVVDPGQVAKKRFPLWHTGLKDISGSPGSEKNHTHCRRFRVFQEPHQDPHRRSWISGHCRRRRADGAGADPSAS
jgi:two-component system, chemotaxis family, sensor kinase CheA